MKKYFPKGIAKGEQFFNRESELKRLLSNIKQGTHTLLIAPRRYGKSSLAKKAIAKSRLPFAEIDLFVAIDDEDVGQKIINGINSVMQQVSDSPEQWFSSLKNYFAKANKKWTVGIKGFKLELIPDNPKTVPENIIDALEALEFFLKKYSTNTVIFIDEFQEISETRIGKAIEGAIRHFAQECEEVIFIFSGSSRHMLLKMFNDRSRPLYALCDVIQLNRIDKKYYEIYLNKVAYKTFGTALKDGVIAEILKLSDHHPRYVYVLCFEVWLQCEKKPPTVNDIRIVWERYVLLQQKDIRDDLIKRSHVQKKLLDAIAMGQNKALTSQIVQQHLKLTSSAIVQALKVLENLDYIEKLNDGSYRIINPVIKTSLKLLR